MENTSGGAKEEGRQQLKRTESERGRGEVSKDRGRTFLQESKGEERTEQENKGEAWKGSWESGNDVDLSHLI